jgi:hypothetical protein
MGMTTRDALVVDVVVGPATVEKTSGGTVNAGGGAKVKSGTCLEDGAAVGSSSEEEEADSVGSAVADASGSIVKVMVAVVVERVMVAVRVMRSVNWDEEMVEGRVDDLDRKVEVDSKTEVDAELEVNAELEEEAKVEVDAEADVDSKTEVEEKDDDVAVMGSTTTVVVPTPLVTSTVVVLVLRPVVLAVEKKPDDCEEPALVEDTNPVDVADETLTVVDNSVDAVDEALPVADEPVPVVAETLAVVDEPGSNNPSGIPPNTCLAFSTSVHPKIAPSVVFIGIAKHAMPGTRQGEISKPSPLVQKASPPATHAVWPLVQADCAVRVAKILLYSRASCRFFW